VGQGDTGELVEHYTTACHTGGYKFVEIFATPGVAKFSVSYSHQYQFLCSVVTDREGLRTTGVARGGDAARLAGTAGCADVLDLIELRLAGRTSAKRSSPGWMMTSSDSRTVKYEQAQQPVMTIIRDENVLGGEPRIEGTRVAVRHVATRVIDGGYSPAYVADQLDIALASVYEALAYYYTNVEEMREFERENTAAFDEIREETLQPKEPAS